MVKVYVAGKWYDRSTIKTFIEQLKSADVEITHDWTITEEEDKKTDQDCARFAELDLQGVAGADAVIIIITDATYPYRGTCVECGAALASRIPIFVVTLVESADFNTNIFMKHPLVHHLSSFDIPTLLKLINI